MLNGADEDAPAFRRGAAAQAEESEVVGLRGPGGEDDFVGVGPDERANRRRRDSDGLRRTPPNDVIAGMRVPNSSFQYGAIFPTRGDRRASSLDSRRRWSPYDRSLQCRSRDWTDLSHSPSPESSNCRVHKKCVTVHLDVASRSEDRCSEGHCTRTAIGRSCRAMRPSRSGTVVEEGLRRRAKERRPSRQRRGLQWP